MISSPHTKNDDPIPGKETARLEAFSDGVFAIAITLLILEIKVPHISPGTPGSNWQLSLALLHLWPSFVAFTLSFGTILIMWINHHGLFRHARRVDNRLLFANGFLLMIVTFVPFPTAVLAEHLNQPAARAAATFYCATYVLVSVGYNFLLWAVVSAGPHPLPAETSPVIARIRLAYRLGLAAYLAGTLASFFSAPAGLVICLSLWPLWAFLKYHP